MENKVKISINVDADTYRSYKIRLIHARTTPTADINNHIRQVAEQTHPS